MNDAQRNLEAAQALMDKVKARQAAAEAAGKTAQVKSDNLLITIQENTIAFWTSELSKGKKAS